MQRAGDFLARFSRMDDFAFQLLRVFGNMPGKATWYVGFLQALHYTEFLALRLVSAHRFVGHGGIDHVCKTHWDAHVAGWCCLAGGKRHGGGAGARAGG